MKLLRRSILRSGVFSATLLLGACLYGFAGGGLPRHIRTVAVRPMENLTPIAELQHEFSEALRAGLNDRLGLRDAPESRAHALLVGTIQRYESDIPISYEASNRGATTARRMVQIVVDIELLDQVTGKVLWQRKGLTGEDQYEERGEPEGRRRAISRIVTAIVEGAQSQW
ncbi:hypothetical protein BH23GEM2_BH23GEM2_21850 [soil metagenome]